MRVNTASGSAYGQVGSASTGNGSDPTHTGSAADQTRDAPISSEPLKSGLSLPFVHPAAVWARLQNFGKQVHQIEQRQREGGALSDADRWALSTYKELRSDPLFPTPNMGRDPTVVRRSLDNPSGMKTTTPVPATKKEDGPGRQYIGGLGIKRDYTLSEVSDIFVDALRNPFASFARSATDSYRKLEQGRPISEEEKQNIDRYTGFIDAAYSITPQGRAMTATASVVETANNARSGKLPSPDSMERAIQSATNVGGGGTPPPTSPPTTTFKPPTRLPDGRVGYPLSPTQPPHLPKKTLTSGPSGTRDPQQGHPSGEPSGGGNPDPQRRTPGTTGAIPRPPPERPTGTWPRKRPVDTARDALSWLRKSSVRNGHVEKLVGKGPFNLESPANQAEESKRIHEFPFNFDFYRKDGEGGMSYGINTRDAQAARELSPHVREDVLTVGTGSQVTSEESDARAFLGNHWGPSRKRLSKEVAVIELANGRNGVGAIRIPYENLKLGQTVAVTGGALSGCTMMYASDTHHFYAYHAGTYGDGKEPWITSRDGANAIRYAHSRVKSDMSTDPHSFVGGNNDLVYVGNKYPFSVIVYNGKYEVPDASGKFLKPSDPQPLDARITEYQGARNPGTYAFDYFISNQQVGQLGTAEAVISKDKQGVVTVRVLAEKGEIELPGPSSRRGGKYTPTETSTYEYKPEGQGRSIKFSAVA